jgi:hypothetical protein
MDKPGPKAKAIFIIMLLGLFAVLVYFGAQAYTQTYGLITFIYAIPVIVSLILTHAFPFFVLFGFFESRKDGIYYFRTKRFLITIVGLIVLSLSAALSKDYGLGDYWRGASNVAERAVLSNRMSADYALHNQAMMFPDVLNEKRLSCYRSAASNFTEDQWNKYFYEESCKAKLNRCAANETAHYNALLNAAGDTQNLAVDLGAIGITLDTIWPTVRHMFDLLRGLWHEPDSKGHIPDLSDDKLPENYRHYFDDCASLKPLPWAIPGEQLLAIRPHLCLGKCP